MVPVIYYRLDGHFAAYRGERLYDRPSLQGGSAIAADLRINAKMSGFVTSKVTVKKCPELKQVLINTKYSQY